MEIVEIMNDLEKKNITRDILEALPDWFVIKIILLQPKVL